MSGKHLWVGMRPRDNSLPFLLILLLNSSISNNKPFYLCYEFWLAKYDLFGPALVWPSRALRSPGFPASALCLGLGWCPLECWERN